MSDLISRSDAIGAVKEERFPIDSDYAEGFMAALDKVEWILKEWLPSAQPETHEERTETHACDCISRQAIEILADEEKLPSVQPDLSGYSDKLWQKAYERGKAEAQQRWIPCSERLPDEEVLCCDTRGEMIIGYPYPDEESNTGFSAESNDVFMIDCAAWMPLPKPYRAERRTDG